MKTEREIKHAILAVMLALYDIPEHSAPEGYIYASLMTVGMSLEDYHDVRDIMKELAWIEVAGNVVTLTEKGLGKARIADESLKARTVTA